MESGGNKSTKLVGDSLSTKLESMPSKVEPMSQELIVSSSLVKPSHKYFALAQGSIYLTSQNAIAFEIQGMI